MKIKLIGFIIMLVMGFTISKAQANTNTHDSTIAGTVLIVLKDYRIDMLGKKMAEYNDRLALRPGGIRIVKGYRLMLLSTSDRNLAMSVRSKLLQRYPEQKVYMTFQSPYIKLKFGNFTEKNEAERYRRQLSTLEIVNNNIYLVPEMVETKFDKNALAEE